MRKREIPCIRFLNTIHQAVIIHEWVEQSHDDNDVLKKLKLPRMHMLCNAVRFECSLCIFLL